MTPRVIPILSAVVLLAAGISRADVNLPADMPTASTPSGPIGITPTSAATASAPTTPAALPPHTANYTVQKGDTLTKLADKFNTTRKKLKDLNDLPTYKVAVGQVILVPSYKKKSVAATTAPKKTYLAAQPVQDFDIPASTFASCPAPSSNDDDTSTPPPATDAKPAPIAQLVSPADLTADQIAQRRAADKAAQKAAINAAAAQAVASAQRAALTPSTTPSATPPPRRLSITASGKLPPAPAGWANPSAAPQPQASKHDNGFLSFFHSRSTSSGEWGNRFTSEARALGDQGIGYDESWRPPGEPRSWEMDCSNTSRYLYKVTANITLPRTASDQYYYLHLQGKAWDVPTIAGGLPDTEYLRENLKPGDLLFWENTYRPERQPPITHVMVFLGTNAQGEWIMAGSQGSRGGEHNRRNGGPDIYVFRPSQPCGGYTSWFVHHKGRFCAFGRPLEADPSKFALND